MNEEETNAQSPKETAEENPDSGDKSAGEGLLERGDKVAERMEKANEEAKAINAERKELELRKTLGGETQSGQPNEAKPAMSDAEYARKAKAGEIGK
jgi:hypothetical protein